MEQRRNFLRGLVGGAALWATAGTPVRAQSFQSRRIVVETRGDGADLILIPGLASTSAVWSRIAGRLPGRLHLVSVRGFGDLPPGANADGALMGAVAAEVRRYIAEAGLIRAGKKGEASTVISRPIRSPASAAARRAIWPPIEWPMTDGRSSPASAI